MINFYSKFKAGYIAYVMSAPRYFKAELVVYDEIEYWREDKMDPSFDYPFMPRRTVLTSNALNFA